MNINIKNFITNFSYTLISNLMSMAISAIVTLVIPKMIGIEEYGYWQLYLFYSSYVGFLHFGWNDGIYLKYGGKEYYELDKKLFFSQFHMLVLFQLVIMFTVLILTNIFVIDQNRAFILKMVSICMFIVNVRCMLLYIMQGTNRIKEYSQVTAFDRLFYICSVVILLLANLREYKLMIIADLCGKLVSLLLSMYYCRDIVFRKISSFYFSFKETLDNIDVGIKLMFANIASMLIIGVIRFGIERIWDVATFGKVSLTLSVSSFLMIFINAVGLVMFPVLRRTNVNKLAEIYSTMRDFLMVVLLGVLIIYYPIKPILSAWLPKYADSLKYMAVLFPMCVYEGKMSLLINTYLKTLRKEKIMLSINVLTLLISLPIAFITIYWLKNLDFAVMSIVFLLAFRCIIAEFKLSKILDINVSKDIILELIMTLLFIISGWTVNSYMSIIVYGLSYFMYIVIKRNDLKKTIQNIKDLLEK